MKLVYSCSIAAAHRLVNKSRSKEWNEEIFGNCYKSVHGHNYKVVVELEGEPDLKDGMLVNFASLKKVINKYDHKNLNDLIDSPTTVERFAESLVEDIRYFCKKEKRSISLIKVSIWETDNAFVIAEKRMACLMSS